jgi:selenide,water dikinase
MPSKPSLTPRRLSLLPTQSSHGGGCGCKIAPGVLRKILARSGGGLLPVLRLFDRERFKQAAVIGKIVDDPERVAVV